MAQNHVQVGASMPWTNSTSSTISSGTPVLVGVLLGVALGDIEAGDEGQLAIEEVFEIPKVSGTALTQGERVYWDETDGEVNTDSENNPSCGVVFAAAASADTTVNVKLNV